MSFDELFLRSLQVLILLCVGAVTVMGLAIVVTRIG